MRGMDMRCAGNPDLATPNLDRLAGEGVRCTSAYAAIPPCCPSRATLLTGTHASTRVPTQEWNLAAPRMLPSSVPQKTFALALTPIGQCDLSPR